MKCTVEWKVYGPVSGSEQKETYEPSVKYDFSVRLAPRQINTRIIEVLNYDKTGTHEYAIVRITRNTLAECYHEFYGQITDGIFENYEEGYTEEISVQAPKSQMMEV